MKLTYKWNYYEPIADTEFYFNVDENGKCIICWNGSELLTHSWKDWAYNFAFWRMIKKDHEGKIFFVHWGLFQKWLLVEPIIIDLINKNLSKIKSFEISGYSQGASTATFCHRFIKINYDLPVKTLISGSPKLFGIGWKNQNKYCSDIISLINKNDIVTKIPFFMKHVGCRFYYGVREKFKLSVKDHLLPEYKEILCKIF